MSGWSLTGTGYRHNEAQLRDELDRVGAEGAVAAGSNVFGMILGGNVVTYRRLRDHRRVVRDG